MYKKNNNIHDGDNAGRRNATVDSRGDTKAAATQTLDFQLEHFNTQSPLDNVSGKSAAIQPIDLACAMHVLYCTVPVVLLSPVRTAKKFSPVTSSPVYVGLHPRFTSYPRTPVSVGLLMDDQSHVQKNILIHHDQVGKWTFFKYSQVWHYSTVAVLTAPCNSGC